MLSDHHSVLCHDPRPEHVSCVGCHAGLSPWRAPPALPCLPHQLTGLAAQCSTHLLITKGDADVHMLRADICRSKQPGVNQQHLWHRDGSTHADRGTLAAQVCARDSFILCVSAATCTVTYGHAAMLGLSVAGNSALLKAICLCPTVYVCACNKHHKGSRCAGSALQSTFSALAALLRLNARHQAETTVQGAARRSAVLAPRHRAVPGDARNL